MQELRLIGVHEDGEHLLLADADGTQFRLRVDDPLRAAIRRDRPRLGQLQIQSDGGLRPRDVQALIRAGVATEEVAERAGWPVEKVRRYEGPILAEREHVASLARGVRLRGRGGTSGGPSATTLATRVGQRLSGRGVDPDEAVWDSWRAHEGPWNVVVTFPAGGRQRQASWQFDLADRTVVAVDDEARWLSEDEQPAPGPIPAPHLASVPVRATTVYDVEAEGGLRATHRPQPAAEPVDLMTAMRERSTARGRRRPGGSRRATGQGPADLPVAGDGVPEEALPLDHIAYDPEIMPPPPAAHGYPGAGIAHEPAAGRDETVFGPSGTASPGTVELDAPVDAEPADILPVDADAAADSDADVAGTVPAQPRPRRDTPEATDAAADEPAAEADEPAADHTEVPDDEAGVTPPAQQSARKNGRPSVPSWDDIMFGARPGSTRR